MKPVVVGGTTPDVPLTQAQIDAQAAQYAYQAAAAAAQNAPTPANIAAAKDAFTATQPATPVPSSATLTPMPTPAFQPGQAGFVGPPSSTGITGLVTPTAAADYNNTINNTIASVPSAIADTQAAIDAANAAAANVTGLTADLAAITPTINAGSTRMALGSDRTLAKDTFKNTLALFFGATEMSQPWVDSLYGYVSNFYNSGSTIDESLNLALQDARNKPEMKPFTDRFAGVFALQDKLVKGEAVTVPTIAEFFHTESMMGDVLRQAGMGELANQKFLGDIIGQGKSVLEVTNLIDQTFSAIDNAPTALKNDLQTFLNLGVSRTDIAKALLTGKDGAQALNKKITEISALSAAKTQGVNVDMGTAADIAAMGYDYNKSLIGFGNVKRLERATALGKMSGIDFTQQEAIASEFQNNVAAQDKIAKIGETEVGRFSGRSGRLNSQSRAQGQI
jgi:hypothetical protein